MKNSSDVVEENHPSCRFKSYPVIAHSTATRGNDDDGGGREGAHGVIAHGRMRAWAAPRIRGARAHHVPHDAESDRRALSPARARTRGADVRCPPSVRPVMRWQRKDPCKHVRSKLVNKWAWTALQSRWPLRLRMTLKPQSGSCLAGSEIQK